MQAFDSDALILGVGIYESILSAAIATDHKQSVNLEASATYSGAFMTLSIKELERLLKEPKAYRSKVACHRDLRARFLEPGVPDLDAFIEKYGFRGFNLDFNPRLIYATGKATDMMVEAQIDNYITFRSLKGLYYADDLEGRLEAVPTDKGGIFKSSHFSLPEKKELFSFLNAAMRYYRREAQQEEDNNSINDFKKNLYSEVSRSLEDAAKDEALMDKHFVEFMRCTGVTSKKLVRLIAACMCNFRVNPFLGVASRFEDQSTRAMLARLTRYIDSMHVHGEIPYVYPIYGTGDITQICSRISAVYGSTFLLGLDFALVSHSVEAGRHQLVVESDGEQKAISCDRLFLGQEYRQLLPQLGEESEPPGPCEQVRYFTAVCKADLDSDGLDKPLFPLLCHLDLDPENSPLSLLVLDHTCGSALEGFLTVHMVYYLHLAAYDEQHLLDRFLALLRRAFPQLRSLEPVFTLDFTQAFHQPAFVQKGPGVTLLPDVDFDLCMDSIFLAAKEHLRGPASPEKLFKREEQPLDRLEADEEDASQKLLGDIEAFKLN